MAAVVKVSRSRVSLLSGKVDQVSIVCNSCQGIGGGRPGNGALFSHPDASWKPCSHTRLDQHLGRAIICSIPIGWLTSSQYELPPCQPACSGLASSFTHPACAISAVMSQIAVQVEADSGSASGQWVLLKGAPEVVQPMLEQVPRNFETVYKQFASQGARRVRYDHALLMCHNLCKAVAASKRQRPRWAPVAKRVHRRFAPACIHACSSRLPAGRMWSLAGAEQWPDLSCAPQAARPLKLLAASAPLFCCVTRWGMCVAG